MKLRVLLLIPLLIITAPLFSQTAARLEALLDTPAVTWGQAAAFALDAADYAIEGMDFIPDDVAFNFAVEQNWLPKNSEMYGTARLNGVALLLMQTFGLKGGIFYSLTKSPHHAYRELVYMDIIPGYFDPGMPVSGQRLILFISRLLARKEAL